VVEADESDGTFLEIGAYGVIVTSVEPDHLEHYGDMAALERAFQDFVRGAAGPRVVCGDDAGAAALARTADEVVTYGMSPGAEYEIHDVELVGGGASFGVRAKGDELGRFELTVPGLHNVRNATAALALATEVGVSAAAAAKGLAAYAGVGRRFELRGRRDGVTYIDDYAHLPTEVSATLSAARQGSWERVVAVFQPHRYSRMAGLWQDFADAFEDADVLVVTGIYAAGEAPRPGLSGRHVAEAVRKAHPGKMVEYAETRCELVELLGCLLRPGDLCLTMGAGDLTTLASELLGSGGGR
jgi:UDP-N-acetylmuramate--alanine ligase